MALTLLLSLLHLSPLLTLISANQQAGAVCECINGILSPAAHGMKCSCFSSSSSTCPTFPCFTVMSANQAAEAVCECISNGAEDFLVKPVTKKEVQNIWTHVVKRSRPGRGMEGVPVRLEVCLGLGREVGRGVGRGVERVWGGAWGAG